MLSDISRWTLLSLIADLMTLFYYSTSAVYCNKTLKSGILNLRKLNEEQDLKLCLYTPHGPLSGYLKTFSHVTWSSSARGVRSTLMTLCPCWHKWWRSFLIQKEQLRKPSHHNLFNRCDMIKSSKTTSHMRVCIYIYI